MSFLDQILAILRVFMAFILILVTITAGYRPLRGALTESRSRATENDRTGLRPFLAELSPILMVIFLGLGLGILLSSLSDAGSFTTARETGLIIAD